jgi:hypothetical protein
MTARKSSRRPRRSNTNNSALRRSDPHAMSTVRCTGPIDPPQITTNVVGMKKIRHLVNIAAAVGALTIGDIRDCLPLSTPEIRILKLSVWGNDSISSTISCVFPVGSATNLNPGDNSVWVDEGTFGQQRAQIHLTPCFEYRNFWFVAAVPASTVIATFGQSGTGASQLIVDLTVQYRTAVQSCPALEYLKELQLQAEDQLCQELFEDVE